MRWDSGYMYKNNSVTEMPEWSTQVGVKRVYQHPECKELLYTHGINFLASSSGRAGEHMYIVVSIWSWLLSCITTNYQIYLSCKEYFGIYTSMKVKNNYSYMVQPGSSKGEEHMHVAVSQLFTCVTTNYHTHSLELHQLCWSKLKSTTHSTVLHPPWSNRARKVYVWCRSYTAG